jgi:hypothetical protein
MFIRSECEMVEIYQCIECAKISDAEEWNKATNGEHPNNTFNLPRDFVPNDSYVGKFEEKGYDIEELSISFVCPHCKSRPLANELIRIPEGTKIVVEPVRIIGDGQIKYNYKLYTFEEGAMPWDHDYWWDYPDWTDNNSFNDEEITRKYICKENILPFLKERHPEVIDLIKEKGLFISQIWYHWTNIKH